MASEEREVEAEMIAVRNRRDRMWWLSAIAEVAKGEKSNGLEVLFTAFCEWWGKKYPRVKELYDAWKLTNNKGPRKK
jgi:hypothetical protein